MSSRGALASAGIPVFRTTQTGMTLSSYNKLKKLKSTDIKWLGEVVL